jgi:hypothetical protein
MGEETLTVKKAAVLEAMKQCPQAKAVLETIFGEQVKPEEEWEKVPLDKFRLAEVPGEGVLVQFQEQVRDLYPLPFKIIINPKSEFNKEFKIESECIYYRRMK